MALKKLGQQVNTAEETGKKKLIGLKAGAKPVKQKPDEDEDDTQTEAEEEEEEGDSYANEVVKGSEAKALSRGRNELPYNGTYKLRVVGVQWFKPSPADERPGRCEFQFEVLEHATESDPEDGWPTVKVGVFVRFPKLGKDGKPFVKAPKQKMREEISEQEGWQILTACLGEFDDGAEYTRAELAQETIGCEVLADNETSKDGMYKNLRRWRPA